MQTQAILAALVPILAAGAAGSQCLVPGAPWIDTSDISDTTYTTWRTFGIERVEYGGDEYLLINTCNEIAIYSTDGVNVSPRSRHNVPPFGDRDCNLFNVAACDDCSIGIAGYETQGTVLFEVGISPQGVPRFQGFEYYPSAGAVGGFVYSWNGNEYLIARGLPGAPDPTSIVYRVTGLEDGDRVPVQTLWDPLRGGRMLVDGGLRVGERHVYLASPDSSQSVHCYRIADDGTLEYRGTPLAGVVYRGRGIRYDAESRLLTTGGSWGVQLWYVLDPETPELLHTIDPNPIRREERTAIAAPYVWAATQDAIGSDAAWLWQSEDAWRVVDPGVWNDLDWDYQSHQDAVLLVLQDGLRILVYSGYSVLLSLTVCEPVTAEVFFDGFETGDSSAWGRN